MRRSEPKVLHGGIDPGKSGAIAIIDGVHVVLLEKLPHVAKGKGRVLDWVRLRDMMLDHPGVHYALEMQGAQPVQSRGAVFEMGRGFGRIEAALLHANDTAQVSIREIRPAQWKAAMGLPKKATAAERKKSSLALAKQLFPSAGLGQDHDKAEALLLAEWRRRQG